MLPDKEAQSIMTAAEDTHSSGSKEELMSEIESLRKQIKKLKLERDVLKATAEIIKKDPGVGQKKLTNREKAILIGALRKDHPLKDLLECMAMSRSSFFYQRQCLLAGDKYEKLKERIKVLFEANGRRYGYRRIRALLVREGVRVSEKVVRRCMAECSLIVFGRKRRRYSAYQGEETPAARNLLKRDFHAERPNTKWLTDITEFHIPAGKVYLSPIIDCYDGMVVSWTIGTSPDADLVNSMLDLALPTLKAGERPIVHSDRGAHYRWPGWLTRMEEANLLRSMSKKGCTADNSACEGFFGRLKNEMFYNRKWFGVSIAEFMDILNRYLHWYNEQRIKMSLGAMSPMEHRRSLNLAA
jgi:transposase InsO family protein